MEINIGPGDYEVLPPERPSFFQKLFYKIEEFSKQFGGWQLIIGISVFFFVFVNLLLPYPDAPVNFLIGSVRYPVPLTEGGKLTLFGSNSYILVAYFKAFWRWVSAGYLHFGLMHLGMNMFGTYILGSFLQKIWNARVLFTVFFISSIGGNIATYFIMKANSAGASSGVFGLMGALLAFFLFNRKLDEGVRQAMLKQLYILLFINVAFGFAASNIDMVGHAGGFVSGFILERIVNKIKLVQARYTNLFFWLLSVIILVIVFFIALSNYFQFL